MRAQHFFHPDHADPLLQLIGAVGEFPDRTIAHFFMEGNALRIRISNAGIDILHILLLQRFLQPFIQQPADTAPTHPAFQINCCFRRPEIRPSGMKCRGIGIADDSAVFHCRKIGICLQGIADAFPKFLYGRNGIFIGDEGIGYRNW